MKNRRTIALVGGLTLATGVLCAQNAPQPGQPAEPRPQDPVQAPGNYDTTKGQSYDSTKGQTRQGLPGHCCKASSIIGKEVRNAQDEKLGKVHDLVVNLESGSVPIALISYGGALGIGDKTVAVPISDLRASSDGRFFLMSATKDELHAATKTPSGAWVATAQEDWAKGVDGFYGQPQTRFERQSMGLPGEDRQQVRDPLRPDNGNLPPNRPSPGPQDNRPSSKKGGEELINKTDLATRDAELHQRVNAVITQEIGANETTVMARTENGVVILTGEVDSEARKREIESRVRALSGVVSVDNRLTVR